MLSLRTTFAVVTLACLAMIFGISVLDLLDGRADVIPETLTRIATAILRGVAIALLVAGLTRR